MLYIEIVLAVLVVLSQCLLKAEGGKKSSKSSTVFKNLQDDVNILKTNNIKCRQSDYEAIIRLKCEQKLDEALLCVGEKLLNGNSINGGGLWTILGQIYHAKASVNKGNKCFKEATKISGKFSAKISLWYFLGPFQIGKPEVDGDPVEFLGGIKHVSCRRSNRNYIAFSELVNGGEIKWSTIRPRNNGIVSVSPNVEWNTLVMGLQSMAVTEWQGWLVGDFSVNSEMTILIQCLGVHTVYISDIILVGDVYQRDQYWHPVHLKPGIHSVMLRARAQGEMVFSCNLQSAESSSSFQIHKPLTPDLVDGHIFSNVISVAVTNHSPTKWLKIVRVTLMSQNSGPDISLTIDKNQRSLPIAPGQLRSVTIYFRHKDETREPQRCADVSGVLRLGSSEGRYEDIPFLIRCRKNTESFLFTFIDHDGSVQHAAAIFPIVMNKPTTAKVYPVLLTLHGTSVSAQNQADSYKRMEKGKWIFGVEGLWTLAPTRHGAHNWEGPGELTSLTALRKLGELTMEHDWIDCKANGKAVLFAGHSMGGHGAWQLSTHHPDIALAVVSLAGWIKKEDYGDSNVFFRHDISVSHTDPSIKHIMEACVSENDADKHVSNLKGIPVMVRVGAKDSTVSPYFSRRMYRLIREQKNNVTYSEVPDMEHWWWNTHSTNDGGVVNDRDVRRFAIKYSKFAVKSPSNPVCSENDESCDQTTTSRYNPPEGTSDRNVAGTGHFTLTLFNPASCDSVRGVHILQQYTPFRRSVVEIIITDSHVTLKTMNVIRLRLTEPEISPVNWSSKIIVVDQKTFPVHSQRGLVFDLCLENAEDWIQCPDGKEAFESGLVRGPANFGPARRIAESSLLIVIGSSINLQTSQMLQQMAVYIANLFYLTSDAFVPVVREKDVEASNLLDVNVIVLGETSESTFMQSYLEKTPLRFQNDDSIRLGRCVFRNSDMGALFLVPHAGPRLALLITGTSLLGIRNAVHLATPTIPPMTRSPFSNLIPDYVITGPEFRAKGTGGYLCTGFWGNRWEYRSDVSSCAC